MPQADNPEVDAEIVADEVVDTVPEFDDFIDVKGDLIANDSIEDESEELDDDVPVDTPADDAPAVGDPADAPVPPAETAPIDGPAGPAAQTPAETAPDPGDFAPARDYSFTLTTTDGKTVSLTNQAEVDAFAARLDSEDDLVSASQLIAFTRGAARMDSGIETERSAYQADKASYEAQAASEQARTDQLNQWSKELTYLRGKGLVPTPTKEADADWQGHKDDPGIKEAQAIFAWMDSENTARAAAGIAPLTSAVDAFRLMQAEQVEADQASERTKAGDTRRAKGARVAGASPHLPDTTPAGTIIGTGGNLRDLLYDYQNSA